MKLIFYPDVTKCEFYEMKDFDSRCRLRSGSHGKSREEYGKKEHEEEFIPENKTSVIIKKNQKLVGFQLKLKY